MSMIAGRYCANQVRSFATTPTRLSILDYFKWRSAKKTTPVASTKEVISKVETDGAKATRIPIIGKRNKSRENLWKTRMNGFRIPVWIPKTSKYTERVADGTVEPKVAIKQLLLDTYNEVYASDAKVIRDDIELNDLQKRFELVKAVQIAFGTNISDYQLTKLKNLVKVKELLHRELLEKIEFNEKEPNAIYLNKEDFEGTNISIGNYISKGQKEKKFDQLVRRARKLEKAEHKKLLEATLKA